MIQPATGVRWGRDSSPDPGTGWYPADLCASCTGPGTPGSLGADLSPAGGAVQDANNVAAFGRLAGKLRCHGTGRVVAQAFIQILTPLFTELYKPVSVEYSALDRVGGGALSREI